MSISSRITEMEQHITNAYDGLEDIGADLTNIDKNINNISTVLDNIWNDLPKVTATDVTEASLDETKKGRMNIDAKGNTYQEQLEGYNLLEVTKVYEQTIRNGVTIETNQDGTITLNGTATANMDVNFMEVNPLTEIELEANQNYILSKKVISGSASRIMIAYKFDGGSSTTFTTDIQNLNSSENVRKLQAGRIFVNNGDVFNNVTVGLMLLKGSTDKNWEPYCRTEYQPQIHLMKYQFIMLVVIII